MKRKISVCIILCIILTVFTCCFVYAAETDVTLCAVENITFSNVSDGIKLTWQSVEGATQYNVYGAVKSENLSLIATVNKCSYTDKNVTFGNRYKYIVCAVNENGEGEKADFSTYVRLNAPELVSAKRSEKGVKIKWNKVSGAKEYRVYKKNTSTGEWVYKAKTSSTSYTDTKVKNGTKYTYTVKAVNGSSESLYNKKGISCLYLAAPKNFTAKNYRSYIRVSWSSLSTADSYTVYRRVSGSSTWKKLGTVSENYFCDKTAVKGKTYIYSAKQNSGKISSAYREEPVKIKRVFAPTPKISATKSGIKITWNDSKYFSSYSIYRKPSGGTWTKIKTFSDKKSTYSFTDKNYTSGKRNYYKIIAISTGGNKAYSSAVSLKSLYGKRTGTTKTFTGLEPIAKKKFKVNDPKNTRGLSETSYSHAFGVSSNGKPHEISVNNQKKYDKYNAVCYDARGKKVIYLTFDCGYENGYTPKILDTLKKKNVPAAFFVTMDYLESAPKITARMINEGHIVGNHSDTHPNFSSLSRTSMANEISAVDNYLRTKFGYSAPYFRFPAGDYSASALELVDSIGFKSVFWSSAYVDWDPSSQKGTQYAFDTVTSRLHPGCVLLLHAVSKDNANALGDIIDYARKQGYVFKSLDYLD